MCSRSTTLVQRVAFGMGTCVRSWLVAHRPTLTLDFSLFAGFVLPLPTQAWYLDHYDSCFVPLVIFVCHPLIKGSYNGLTATFVSYDSLPFQLIIAAYGTPSKNMTSQKFSSHLPTLQILPFQPSSD